MKIELHIERLILDGLKIESGQGAAIQAALAAELTRLLMANGLRDELMAGGALPSMRAGTVEGLNQIDPEQLGSQIAQAVHGQIGNPEGNGRGRLGEAGGRAFSNQAPPASRDNAVRGRSQ